MTKKKRKQPCSYHAATNSNCSAWLKHDQFIIGQVWRQLPILVGQKDFRVKSWLKRMLILF